MKAKIIFSDESPWKGGEEVLENISEIHYNYPYLVMKEDIMIAFESDINGYGMTYPIKYIKEFEAK